MRNIALVILFVSGVLLLLLPSILLPVCEYSGFPRMHCSDTAMAEYVIGLLFIGGALGLFLVNRPVVQIAVTGAAALLSVAAFFAPDIFGYCNNPRMPCHQGTVPAIRAVAVATALAMTAGLISFSRSRKGRNDAA